tara:strand:+ start:3874 stop:4362 length:489 start_codon:yes stop_codon:yes gene_type:complete
MIEENFKNIFKIRLNYDRGGFVKKYNSSYKYIYYDNMQFVCHYCGISADTVDHVPPISYFEEAKYMYPDIFFVKVPCCRECNSLAGSTFHINLFERNEFLFDKYKKRYKKILSMPEWTSKELKEKQIGKNLKLKFKNDTNFKQEIKKRLNFLSNNFNKDNVC